MDNTKEQVNFRLDKFTKKQLEEEAKEKGLTISELIRIIILKYYKKF